MKKRYASLALCTALAALVMAGCSANAASSAVSPVANPSTSAADETSSATATPEATAVAPVAAPATQTTAGIAGSADPNSGYITEDQAKAAALEHAGLAESDLQWVNVRLEYEDGRAEYDVEFVRSTDTGVEEYDYELDATTGEILSYDYDAENYGGGQAASGTSTGSAVTADQAKQIALQHAGVAEADCRAMEMETDRDDGRTTYEFSWKIGRTEYDYEIDADTGEILSFSQEEDD